MWGMDGLIAEAYEALEGLYDNQETCWAGIVWDGNPDNVDAWHQVHDAIWESISFAQPAAENFCRENDAWNRQAHGWDCELDEYEIFVRRV